MANVKISALPAGSTPVGTEIVPGVQSAATVSFTLNQIAGLIAGHNPTATAGPAAVNGVATTYMRSDGAPAIQKASASVFGIVEVDGTTITAASGVISAVQPAGANPTATAGASAINGSASTFMRSDGAPAIAKASSSVFGIVEVDNTTITASSGVISTPGGANPTGTAGPSAVNGSATTFMRSDGAPAIKANLLLADVIAVIDGGGSAIAGGKLVYIPVDFDCTIQQVTLLADQSGSIVCNVWACTYAQFDAGSTHPVSGDSITASATPTITSATKYQDSTLTGWTKTIAAGTVLAFEINATATSITRLTAALKVTKT